MAEKTPDIRVDLPPEIHDIPLDEQAVAIHDVAVNPESVERTDTLTVELRPSQTLAAGKAYAAQAALEAAAAPASLPPLPQEAKPESRYGRRYKAPRADRGASASAELAQRVKASKATSRALPEGVWPEIVYGLTLTAVNLGDSRTVRFRKAIDARIGSALDGSGRIVPVISRQGGVGATTVTALLGLALADGRDDRVLAVDAHPDRAALAERVATPDQTGLEVARLEDGFATVAEQAAAEPGVVLTDGATGVADETVRAALEHADGLVLVSGGTAEQARAASDTITWLEEHDLGHLAADSVVVVDTATPGTRYESLDAIERHFRARVRDVVRIPYDEELVAGAPVRYGALRPDTREAARELAAAVVTGLTESGAA